MPHDASRSAELSETLVRTARLIKSYRHQVGGPVAGLESALVPLLFTLEHEPRRVTEVADQVHSDVSTISRQVSTLTSLGMVTKSPDPADRRALRVELTAHGRDVLAQLRRHRSEVFAGFVADWTPEQVDELHTCLTRFADSVERSYHDLLTRRAAARDAQA